MAALRNDDVNDRRCAEVLNELDKWLSRTLLDRRLSRVRREALYQVQRKLRELASENGAELSG